MPETPTHRLSPPIRRRGITRRECLQRMGTWVTGLPLLATGCATGRADPPTPLPPPALAAAPFPLWGVTLLSWNAHELPTAVSWQPQTWSATVSPEGHFTMTDQALHKLRAAKIPAEVVGKLQRFKGQKWPEMDTFLQALQTEIGEAYTTRCTAVLCGSRAIQRRAITTARPERGRGALELMVDLRGGHLTHCTGEVFVDLRYHPPQGRGHCCRHIVPAAPLDLRGATVTARVFTPRGSEGPVDSPNGLQLFLKSVQERGEPPGAGTGPPSLTTSQAEAWRDYYGNWRDIEAPGWNPLTLNPDIEPRYGYRDPDFNATRIGLLGLKIGAGRISTERFTGTLWVDDVTITWPDGCQATYDFEQVDDALAVLQKTRINIVTLIPTWYMDTPAATTIHRDNYHTGAKTYPDEELIATIEALQQRQCKVLLKPHVDCTSPPKYWRGDIRIRPVDVDAWFASYRHFILHYATLAAKHRVAMFAVGTELESMQRYTEAWSAVIQAVRQRYPGTLTYAANWFGNHETGATGGYRGVGFWHLLDVAGIDAYFPLSDARDPSLQDLINGWTQYEGDFDGLVKRYNWVAALETWHAQLQKPVLFTEIGYGSADSAAHRPADELQPPANPALQARCYEAAVRSLAGKPWLQGLIWWGWSPFADAGGPCDTSYTPQHKPAQALL